MRSSGETKPRVPADGLSAVQWPLVEELSPAPEVTQALEALADQPAVVLLESALPRKPVARYSFLTADPFEFYEIPRVAYGIDPFADIREKLIRYGTAKLDGLPPFQGGAAGLLSYELAAAWENLPRLGRDEFALPDLAVGLYDWVIAWDHQTGRCWCISQGLPELEPARRTDRAAFRLKQVKQLLERGGASRSTASYRERLPVNKLVHQWPAAGLPGLTSDFSRDGYLKTVERVIEYIHAGDIFQANLSQRLLYPLKEAPLDLYLRLRRCNAAPFAGYFAASDWAILSASPERFVCVRNGEIETRPIKGTRQRRTAPEADLFSRDELRESQKDQSENVMIVDLMRNDLSRVCRPGTVRVPQLCAVETYETVQHLVSEIRADLAAGRDVWDLLRAVFPGGSITGAPKLRAIQIIAELEPTVRGAYCGSLFYAGFDGTADSNLLIRTFTARKGWIQCPVGGGIVAQSEPKAEYEETLHKAEGMLRAVK